MIFQNNKTQQFLAMILLLVCSCTPAKKHEIVVYGAFYAEEILFIEVNDELKFQKKFTKKPMEMCGDIFTHSESSNNVRIHIFTKFQNRILLDTVINGGNTKPKYHLLFSVPFVKRNGKLVNLERTIPIDSSIRIVDYMVHNPAWDDVRK